MSVFVLLGQLLPFAVAVAFAIGLLLGHRKGREYNKIDPPDTRETLSTTLTLSEETEREVWAMSADEVERRFSDDPADETSETEQPADDPD